MNNSKELSLKALKAAIDAATSVIPEMPPEIIPKEEMDQYLPKIQNGSSTPASMTKSHEAILAEQKQKVLAYPEKYGLPIPTVEQQLAIVRAVRDAVEQGVSVEDIKNLLNKPVYHNTFSYNDVTSTSYQASIKDPGKEKQSTRREGRVEYRGGVGEYNEGEAETVYYDVSETYYEGRTYNYAYTHEILKRTRDIDFTLFDILNADVKAEIVHNAVDQAYAWVINEMENQFKIPNTEAGLSAHQAKVAYYSSIVDMFAQEKSAQNQVAQFNHSKDALAKATGERKLKIAYGENYDAAKLFFVEMMKGFLKRELFEQQSDQASASRWIEKNYKMKPNQVPKTGVFAVDVLLAKKFDEVFIVNDEIHAYLPLASYAERMGRNLKSPDQITDEYVIKCMSDPMTMKMLQDNLLMMKEKHGDYNKATQNLAALLSRVHPGRKEWDDYCLKVFTENATIDTNMPNLEKMIALVEWLQDGEVVTISHDMDTKGRLISNGYNDAKNLGHNAIEGILPYLGVMAVNMERILARPNYTLPRGLSPINIDRLKELKETYGDKTKRPAALSADDKKELENMSRVFSNLKLYVQTKNDASMDTVVGRLASDFKRKVVTFSFSSDTAPFRCEREDFFKWPKADLPTKPGKSQAEEPDTKMQVENKSSSSTKPGKG